MAKSGKREQETHAPRAIPKAAARSMGKVLLSVVASAAASVVLSATAAETESPFGESATVRLPVRTWTDVTGRHRTEAEFIELRDGKVRLQERNGRTVDVPIGKLSRADRETAARSALTQSATWQTVGEYDRAIAICGEVIRAFPKLAAAYRNRGLVSQDKGDTDRAIADFTEAIRLDPKSTAALNSRGLAWHSQGDDEKALADFSAAIRIDPKLAGAYRNRGMIHKSLWQFDEAMADFDEAIRLEPQTFEGYVNRAVLCRETGDLDGAIAGYSEAIRVDPNREAFYVARAYVWRMKGDLQRQIADFSEAIRVNPNSAGAYQDRGRCWMTLAKYDQAAADFTEVIRLRTAWPDGHVMRGWARVMHREPEQALADAAKALRLAPEFARAYELRAVAHLMKRDVPAALADAERYLKLEPTLPSGNVLRGSIRTILGQHDEAAADFAKAQEKAPQLDSFFAATRTETPADVHPPAEAVDPPPESAHDPPAGEALVEPGIVPPRPMGPRFPIDVSEQTTRLLGPLRADGSVDYVAALNARHSQGVTPENNAAVLLWRAMGPGELAEEDRDRFFRLLGIAPLPDDGPYYVSLGEYLTSRGAEGDGTAESDGVADPWEKYQDALQRPWTKAEFPALAGWLEANDQPLRLIVEATQRPRYYSPLVETESVPFPMVAATTTPTAPLLPKAANLLCARAMLGLGEGQLDEAAEDLLVCHRLARLVGQGPTLIHALRAMRISSMACVGDRVFAHCGALTPRQARRLRTALRELPPMPRIAEKIERSERYMALDIVRVTAVGGPRAMFDWTRWISFLNDDEDAVNPDHKPSAFPGTWVYNESVDFNEVLAEVNFWYDRVVAACSYRTRPQRTRAAAGLHSNCALMSQLADWQLKDDPSYVMSLSYGVFPPETTADDVTHFMFGLVTPAFQVLMAEEDRATMRLQLAELAYALTEYRGMRGRYPKRLDDLSPRFVEEVPEDLFTEKELRYESTADGYLLYSLGPNGIDDGGCNDCEGDPEADDLAIDARPVKTATDSPNETSR